MSHEQFLAENGQHPDFGTDFEAAFAHHRKLVALCVEGRRRAQEQAMLAERDRFGFPGPGKGSA